MDLGIGKARRYIDISAHSVRLGSAVSRALLAFQEPTGCDFNPTFFRRGKKKPLNVLMSSEDIHKVFADLGSEDCNMDESFNIIQSYICRLYGFKK